MNVALRSQSHERPTQPLDPPSSATRLIAVRYRFRPGARPALDSVIRTRSEWWTSLAKHMDSAGCFNFPYKCQGRNPYVRSRSGIRARTRYQEFDLRDRVQSQATVDRWDSAEDSNGLGISRFEEVVRLGLETAHPFPHLQPPVRHPAGAYR